jgi:hypothetical protein
MLSHSTTSQEQSQLPSLITEGDPQVLSILQLRDSQARLY